MKRSEINSIIKRFECLLDTHQFKIPGFLYFSPEDWANKGDELQEIRDTALGWDVTDYGMGMYEKLGLALITLRNGKYGSNKYPKPYAEKIIMLEEGQISPMHFHKKKMEDIINRGGGNLVFTLYMADDSGRLSTDDIWVQKDGYHFLASAGTEILLKPGESLTLYPNCFHEFRVEAGGKAVLIGEVSACNDDEYDNFFLQELGRFPIIEEDEAPYRLLCTEYPK